MAALELSPILHFFLPNDTPISLKQCFFLLLLVEARPCVFLGVELGVDLTLLCRWDSEFNVKTVNTKSN